MDQRGDHYSQERDLEATQERALSAIIFKAVLERSFHPTSSHQLSANCDFPPAPLISSVPVPLLSLALYRPTLQPPMHAGDGGGGHLHFSEGAHGWFPLKDGLVGSPRPPTHEGKE